MTPTQKLRLETLIEAYAGAHSSISDERLEAVFAYVNDLIVGAVEPVRITTKSTQTPFRGINARCDRPGHSQSQVSLTRRYEDLPSEPNIDAHLKIAYLLLQELDDIDCDATLRRVDKSPFGFTYEVEEPHGNPDH